MGGGGAKQSSCIYAIQTRAERFFLGIGEYTPNAAVHSETVFASTIIKQRTTVADVWCRLHNMDKTDSITRYSNGQITVSGNGCKNAVLKLPLSYKR